jgi:GntR family transcriptional repressor for pyruvate dehydrogenase complex
MKRIKATETTLQEQICEAVKDYIIDHSLQSGDRLPSEHEMAASLGVSRASIREAMTSLSALGLIEVKAGRGAFVREFDFSVIAEQLPYALHFCREDLDELVEIRRLLEVYAIGRVAGSIDEAYLERLRSVVDVMDAKAKSGDDFIDEDIRFHSLISEAGGWRVLSLILSGFWQLQRRIRRVETDAEALAARYMEHQHILQALENRDSRAAVYYMEVHFDRLQSRLGIAQ